MQTYQMNPEAILAREKRSPESIDLAKRILKEYDPKTAKDMEDALKDIFGPLFETMLGAELDDHLGYENNERSPKDGENRRNGYSKKTLKTTKGDVTIDVPRDRDASLSRLSFPRAKKTYRR